VEVAGQAPNRIDCYAVLRAATAVGENDVRLGSVQLDERGHLKRDPGRAERDVLLSRLAPGSVTAEALAAPLRRGWVKTAFHPTDVPQDDDKAQPPFRVGATQAEAHRNYGGQPNTKGAGGTMAIMLPPGVRQIHRLAIAGAVNEDIMTVSLLKGGFDSKTKKHLRDEILKLTIPAGAYEVTETIPDQHRDVSDPLRTLAVDVRAKGFAGVSLIALETSY
jgi:hypothetical protein